MEPSEPVQIGLMPWPAKSMDHEDLLGRAHQKKKCSVHLCGYVTFTT